MPTNTPVAVIDRSSCSALASPKSVTFTKPCEVTTRFEGFTSRWTTPTRCVSASPIAA